LSRDPQRLVRIPPLEYLREAGAEAIELVMWLIMRGALGRNVREVHRFYHVPASSTAVGNIILENAPPVSPRKGARSKPKRAGKSARRGARPAARRAPGKSRAKARKAK